MTKTQLVAIRSAVRRILAASAVLSRAGLRQEADKCRSLADSFGLARYLAYIDDPTIARRETLSGEVQKTYKELMEADLETLTNEELERRLILVSHESCNTLPTENERIGYPE